MVAFHLGGQAPPQTPHQYASATYVYLYLVTRVKMKIKKKIKTYCAHSDIRLSQSFKILHTLIYLMFIN